jgi:phage tail sheath protein FI
MPEYLAPDVYVEEIDTGSKPIEGVSTSTAGMLGVTERGPANVPILITSNGEFQRWFGGLLDPREFVNPVNALDLHCFLPHAMEGFFTNGGKRVYVTRVEARGATRAGFLLHDRGQAASANTWLLRSAPEGSGNAAATAAYVVDIDSPNPGALANGNHVRVGRGSESEYRDIGAAGIGAANHVSLNFPLRRAHAAPAATIHEFVRVPIAPGSGVAPIVNAATQAGAAAVEIQLGALADLPNVLPANGLLLEFGNAPRSAEHRFVIAPPVTVSAVAPFVVRVALDAPLHRAYAAGDVVTRIDPAPGGANEIANTTVEAGHDAGIGDRVVYLAAIGANFVNRDHLVVLDRAVPAPPNAIPPREVRRIGRLSLLRFAFGNYEDYDVNSRVEVMNPVVVGGPRALRAGAPAGSIVLQLDNRVGIVANSGMVLQVGAAAPFEYVPIAGVPNRSAGLAPPDPGPVQLAYPLRGAYPNATPVTVLQPPVAVGNRPAGVTALASARDAAVLVVTDGGNAADLYALNDLVQVMTPAGTTFYHQLAAAAALANAVPVTFTVPFAGPHAAGSPIAERAGLLQVQALDTGAWGDRLRISVTDSSLAEGNPIVGAIAPNRIRLDSAAGVEPGALLEIRDGAATPQVTVKVMAVDRATGEVTLDPGLVLTPLQVAAVNAVPRAFTVVSREFTLTVRLYARPDPAVPGSGEEVLDSETFRFLSLDPRHPRYVQTIIGDTNGPPRLADRRPAGESWYVRVHDPAQDIANDAARIAALNSIRPAPEALTDVLRSGREQPARHSLDGGDDSMAMLNDNAYIGVDNANPELRTGLFSLNNIEDISIVAAPGRTNAVIQNALITHCELARYRFAVLDAQRAPLDAIANVIAQRQQFDTKYAAIYHPWLLVPPPFPVNPNLPNEYQIPPSGHMLGVYARTDIERGVHKAPANEVVRGIIGLQRVINKGEHDILNPYPININVIRDFRSNSRGIRAYGGRVITSDSDWKYVNVRRLLIFIEASINRGLQWVVFEPNAEPLWARVRRSIANFLTLVWRNGALEGTKVEEAFFVKCDRTTMTQTDIDSGRLICYVGVAPVKPAEFVIVRIGLWTAHADE